MPTAFDAGGFGRAFARGVLAAVLIVASTGHSPATAQSLEEMSKRLDRLEAENAELKRALQSNVVTGASMTAMPSDAGDGKLASAGSRGAGAGQTGFVHFNSDYSYQMLDATTAGKQKPLTILEAKQSGALAYGITVGGAITAIADYQTTKYPGEVGYLMRHPENQKGKSASEIALHSVQFAVTANINSWIVAYGELLWDPEQSFGAGSITSLARNEVQLRKGYLLLGDLQQSPFYAMIGKIESPFSQTDTVSPFTLSTNWHLFSGLSYGALVGYSRDGLNLSAEAVQGGAEFRGLNTPVDGGNLPSRLNNFVLDANYRLQLGEAGRSIMLGASYEHGSSYCLDFPVAHFSTCSRNNPAIGTYAELKFDDFRFKGAISQTVDPMPGSFNPNAPLNKFAASKVTSFDIGGVYRTPPIINGKPLFLSAEYSAFVAGPQGAPWHSQSQFVTGLAYYPMPNVKVFVEDIAIQGYAPLNFMSGGIPGENPGTTESNSAARSHVVIAGLTVAF